MVVDCTETMKSIVDDITPLRQDFNFDAQIEKLQSVKFPFTGEGKNKRSFQFKWIYKYQWIEYSLSRDAVFCYVCRQFGHTEQNNDSTFTISGFKNWKKALDKNHGFHKHEMSRAHKIANEARNEQMRRKKHDLSVSTLVNTTVLLKRRYYMSAIIKTIMFLAGHQLALRGDWDIEEQQEGGLFNGLFEFACHNDPELAACAKFIPSNATYKSPLIQNEIIAILAKLLRAKIVQEVVNADVPYFTILFDGTKDRKGSEIISLAARFVSSGKVYEALLFLETSTDLDASAFTELILNSMTSYELDSNRIISQCYDGAPVMNGYKTGVAKRLENELQKEIPYIHCFNHRIHLVIIDAIKQIPSVKHFFDQVQLIYTMFHKPKIKKVYEGQSVTRLLDTRWTGHSKAAKSLLKNYKDVVDTLVQIKNISSSDINTNAVNKKNPINDIDGDDKAICIGILDVITKKEFIFHLLFVNEVLSVISPADTIFQKREIGYKRAMPVIEAVKSSIAEYRSDEKFFEFVKKTEDFMSANISPPIIPLRPVRQNRQRSTYLKEFIIEESLGERSTEEINIKSAYFQIIDVILSEFNARFTENNKFLLALSSADNFDLQELKVLEELGVKLPSQCELSTAKRYVEGKRREHEKINAERVSKNEKELPRFNLLATLFEVREAFPEVYNLFAVIETFACSTSTCEASFSSLSRVDITSRMSMSNARMRNLAFLGFEHKRLMEIEIIDVLHAFDEQKNRKIQLF